MTSIMNKIMPKPSKAAKGKAVQVAMPSAKGANTLKAKTVMNRGVNRSKGAIKK